MSLATSASAASATSSVDVVLAQLASDAKGDVAANVKTLELAAAQARASFPDARVLVTPELFLSGYLVPPDTMRALAAPLDFAAPIANAFVAAARRVAIAHGIDVVTGFPSTAAGGDPATVYNTAVWVAADGTVVALYDKAHLWGPDERALFTPGPRPPPPRSDATAAPVSPFPVLVDRFGLRFAVLICYDVEFPEPCRLAALRGAAAVIVLTATLGPAQARMIGTRAAENCFTVVQVNHAPPRFYGHSQAVGSAGDELCGAAVAVAGAAEGAELRLATVRPPAVHDHNAYLADRRPELYATLGLL